jgi:pyrimidine-nucleoside phosphorylase
MNEPLGKMVGNSLEVIEAIDTLKGKGPKVFTELCYELSAQMLLMAGISNSIEDAKEIVDKKIKSGEALNKLREMIIAQGGNPEVIDNYDLLPKAKHRIAVPATKAGYIKDINAEEIGLAGMFLGAGRATKDDIIDHAVGVEIIASVGDYVNQGEPLVYLYYNDKGFDDAKNLIYSAYKIDIDVVNKGEIILDIVR